MYKEFEKYLIFAGSFNIFNYYLRYKEDRNKYSYVFNANSLKGFNKVGIILLYEWDQKDTIAKYNWIITLLYEGSKVVGEKEYISEDNWNIFEKIQNPQ